jgi:sortase A
MSRRLIHLGLLALGLALLAKGLYIPVKAALAQQLIQSAWTQSLETGKPVLPWSWMDAYPIAELQLSDSQSHIVLNTDSGQALAFGPGLVTGTSIAPDTMTAIAAHKNTQFASLKNLEIGDIVSLKTKDGLTHHYKVKSHDIVDTRHEQVTKQETPSLLLVTCYPFDAVSFNGPMRYIVYADKIDTPNQTEA